MDPLLAAVAIGLLVGLVVGALGAGGGIIAIPVLIYVLGQSPHSATATSLVIVGATALVGLVHHVRRGNVNWSAGLSFGLLGIVGSVAGSLASALVDGRILLGLFAGVLAVVAVLMVRQTIRTRRLDREPEPAPVAAVAVPRPAWWKVVVTAVATGLMTGFFGLGGGFIVVPVMVLVLGLPMRTASATSLVVMVIASLSGLLTRLGTQVVIDWPLAAAFTAASMVGGMVGGPISNRIKPWKLSMTFAGLVGVVAVFVSVQLILDLG